MLTSHKKIYARIGIVVDLALTILAFIVSYYIKKHLLPAPLKGLAIAPNYYDVLFLIIIVWYAVFYFVGTHKFSYRTNYTDITYKIFQSILIGMVTLNFLLYILKIPDVSRLLQLIFYFLNFITLILYKVFLINWRRKWHHKDYNLINILFVGCNESTMGVIDQIAKHGYGEYKIVGCLANVINPRGSTGIGDYKTLGNIEDLENILKTYVVDEIVISTPINQIKSINKCLSICENSGVTIHIFPDWGVRQSDLQPRIGKESFNFFCGVPSLSIRSTHKESDAILLKYALDYILALFLVTINLPIFLIISFTIKLISKGPIFFVQERVGLYGRKFDMYKFRTMVDNADNFKNDLKALNESDGPVFKIKKDPRIIPYIGILMRKTGLDELPQLINILKGDMSLVGPRPPVESEVAEYDFWQRRRLSMKPGISCLWQVSSNRNDISFADWMKMDLEYIDKWSLALDLKIILETVFTVFRAQGR